MSDSNVGTSSLPNAAVENTAPLIRKAAKVARSGPNTLDSNSTRERRTEISVRSFPRSRVGLPSGPASLVFIVCLRRLSGRALSDLSVSECCRKCIEAGTGVRRVVMAGSQL